MDFIFAAPSLWDSFGEAIYFAHILLYLSEIARFVKGLEVKVFLVKVSFSIHSSGQSRTIVSNASTPFEINDAHDLLVELASTVVERIEWSYIGLEDLVVADYIRV